MDKDNFVFGFCDAASMKNLRPGQGCHIPLEFVDAVVYVPGSDRFTLTVSGQFPDGTDVAKVG